MRDATLTTTAFVAALLITAAHAEGDAPRGEAHFKDCAACHKLDADANEVGPSLHGIFPREAGELTDFHYSPAMKQRSYLDGRDPRQVHRDPQAFIPANRMPYAGMSNASDRADLIAYLQKATH